MKICLQPYLNTIESNNGIGRVVYAQYKYLPALGFEFVTDPAQADLCIGHTRQFDMPRIDVLILHGMYWLGDPESGEYNTYHIRANDAIIDTVRKAKTIIVPSQWTGECLRRDMRIDPIVIRHGIDLEDWPLVTENGGYILYGKNRDADVCRADAPYELAKRGLPIVSTFAPDGVTPPHNMQIIGPQDSEVMKQWIQQAAIYLSVTKETFGIQTIEALASGVPIVGWNYGGTAEIVTNGVDGILVRPGDYDALADAVISAASRRDELSAAARKTALKYGWQDAMQQYADVFNRTYDEIQHESHGVSIVITTHNYAGYVCEAVDSAIHQTMPPAEIVVVDDGSTDDTLERLAQYANSGVKVITQKNQGVAAARTAGIEATTQPYITCLDADDKLDPRYIETLLPVIDRERDMGIVYSNLTLFKDDGSNYLSNGFPPDFDWEKQAEMGNPPRNCIPSAAMFRRDLWRRGGPHKQEYAPGEDAEFWTRGLSIGFKALKVTNEGLSWYRLHGASATRRLKYKPIDDRLPWMRDRRYPLAAPSKFSPLVMSYSEPKVSIVVTVTGDQARHLPDTIDSILGQTMRDWELIVVNATGKNDTWKHQPRYPFMRYVGIKQIGNAARARNAGIEVARADLVMFMACGDMLTNSALEEMLTAHVNSGGRYIYTDILSLSESNKITPLQARDYDQSVWQKPLHALTTLIPTTWARAIGFIKIATWLDGDFYSRMAIAGYCGQRLGRALVIVHSQTHDMTAAQQRGLEQRRKNLEDQSMAGCCGGNGDALMAAKNALAGMVVSPVPIGKARLEFIGPQIGAVTYRGKKTGRAYRGGNNDLERYCDVDEGDVEFLISTGSWRLVTMTIRAPVTDMETIAAMPVIPAPIAEMAIASAKVRKFKNDPTVSEVIAESRDEMTPEAEQGLDEFALSQGKKLIKKIKANAPEPVPDVIEVTEEDKALNEQISTQMKRTRKRDKA